MHIKIFNPLREIKMYSRIKPLLYVSFISLFITITIGVSASPQESSVKESPPVPSAIADVLENLNRDIRKVELENGLKLIMMRRTYAPTTALYIKFRAGGVDETPETAGIAHMLEHMLFKGTRRLGTTNYEKEEKYIMTINAWARRLDEWKKIKEKAIIDGNQDMEVKADKMIKMWSRRISSLSTDARKFMVLDEDSYIYSLQGQRGYNAYTSRDLTNYQIELPSNRIEVWARLESDRVENSVLRDFYTERDVVAEERRMRVDNVSRNLLIERFLEMVYGDHPYGKPLIGSEENIRYLNYEMAYDFYHTYYAPNNMVIAIVGDINFDETEGLIRNYFGHMKSRAIPSTEPGPVNPKPVRLDLNKAGSPYQIHAWFKPSLPHVDDLKLDVLSRILSGSPDTRLFKRLVMDSRTASQISVYSGYPGERFDNLFLVLSVPSPDHTYDEIEKEVLDELKDIAENGVNQDELNRVIRNMETDLLYSLRSNSVLADRLSYYETITGNYKTMFELYSTLDSITPEDIQNVVKTYLTEDKMMRARLQPPR